MQGRMVDIDKLRAANEAVQAVGNMNVNARGDVIGQGGRVVRSKSDVMKEYYETPKGVAQDTAIKAEAPQPKAPQPKAQPQVMNPTVKQIQEKPVKTVSTFKPKAQPKAEPKEEPKSGIDAALDGIE